MGRYHHDGTVYPGYDPARDDHERPSFSEYKVDHGAQEVQTYHEHDKASHQH